MAMTPRQKIKLSVFTLEGLNSFGTVFYFNYLYFWMRDAFGFGNKRNLALAASLGLVYTIAAWRTGKFAQRHGYFSALKTGYVIMALAFAVGLVLSSFWKCAWAEISVAIIVTLGMCFIWPTLEAFVSEGETAEQLPRMVGIYNVVWALTAALAYFTGGSLIKFFSYKVIFALPLVIVLGMFALAIWLQGHAAEMAREALEASTHSPPKPHQPGSPHAKVFLRLAWLANPFAYIAIQTLIAVIPGIAAKFQLSPMMAGFACTLWYFVRVGSFVALWHWPHWHYRFHWLAAAFVILIASFAAIFMAPNLVVLVIAQIFLGAAIGLMYYSSLFYSMDAGDTKGEHGGIHEAAIGMGNCIGPAIGALSLQFLPQYANSAGIAVSLLLLCGFAVFLVIWKMGRTPGTHEVKAADN
jgi:predicted MFS family arabinose efflux permease